MLYYLYRFYYCVLFNVFITFKLLFSFLTILHKGVVLRRRIIESGLKHCKIKNYSSFLSPEGAEVQDQQNWHSFYDYLQKIAYNTIRYIIFQVWLRTSCNPADIYPSCTVNCILFTINQMIF